MTLYNVMRFTNTTHLIQVEAQSEDEAKSMAELIQTTDESVMFIDEESYDIIPEPWKAGDN
jgi:hypothetical protein